MNSSTFWQPRRHKASGRYGCSCQGSPASPSAYFADPVPEPPVSLFGTRYPFLLVLYLYFFQFDNFFSVAFLWLVGCLLASLIGFSIHIFIVGYPSNPMPMSWLSQALSSELRDFSSQAWTDGMDFPAVPRADSLRSHGEKAQEKTHIQPNPPNLNQHF